MKIKMLKDHDHRVKPAVIQAFRADREYTVPKSTGISLINVGAAEEIATKPKEA
jgi:hypothetical protein